MIISLVVGLIISAILDKPELKKPKLKTFVKSAGRLSINVAIGFGCDVARERLLPLVEE